MKTVKIYLIIYLISTIGFAQDWFSAHQQGEKIPGHIIGMAGDKIQGWIMYDYPVIMQKRIYFFAREQDPDPTIYEPDNIRGYSILDKKWVSATVTMFTYDGPFDFKRFGILESEEGPIMLLRIFNENDKLKKKINSAEAEKEIDNIKFNYPEHSIDQLYIIRSDGEAEPVFIKDFKRSFLFKMKVYVGRNEDLLQKIESRKYTLKDIYTIVSEYNSWSASIQK